MADTAQQSASALTPARALGHSHFLTADSDLRIDSFNSAVGVILTIALRILGMDGQVESIALAHTPLTTRLIKTENYRLREGWLLSAQVIASTGSPRRGQCFVRVSLIRGLSGASISEATVLQGYVMDTNAIAWPGSAIRGSAEGPGVIRSIVGTNPAAGLEISEVVPANTRWRLQSFRFQLVASVAAANRRPTLIIDDGANELWRQNSNVNQVASETSVYEAAAGASYTTIDARTYSLPLPSGLVLAEGFRIRTLTAAIDAGDDYAAPIYSVEEWIED